MTGAPPRGTPWRGALVLAALGMVAVFLALPRPLSPALFAFAAPLAAALAVSGAILGWSCGLGAPLLDALLHRRPAAALARGALVAGLASGAALGGATILLLRFALVPVAPVLGLRIAAEAAHPAWTRWLIAFDAAVAEEILYRLFLVSALVVLLRRILGRPGVLSAEGTVRLAVGGAALLFAAAHLPRWADVVGAASGADGAAVFAVVLLLNFCGGVVFGVVYVRRGIEAAMLAHFAADVVLHVAGPLVLAPPAMGAGGS